MSSDAHLTNRLGRIDAQCDALAKEQLQIKARFATLEKNLDSLVLRLDNIKEKTGTLERHSERDRDQLKDLKGQVDVYQLQLSENQRDIVQEQQHVERIKYRLDNVRIACINLQTSAQGSKSDIEQLKSSMIELRQSLASLAVQLTASDHAISELRIDLRSELLRINTKLEDLNTRSNTAAIHTSGIDNDIKNLQARDQEQVNVVQNQAGRVQQLGQSSERLDRRTRQLVHQFEYHAACCIVV